MLAMDLIDMLQKFYEVSRKDWNAQEFMECMQIIPHLKLEVHICNYNL